MSGPDSVTPIYVVHSPALAERRAPLARVLDCFGWQATWIEAPDSRDVGVGFWLRHRPHPRLNRAQISVYLKHLEVLRRVAASGAADAFVLEDDAEFGEDFPERFAEYRAGLPEAFDFAFFGQSCGMEAEPIAGHPHFGAADRARSMSGYLVRAGCCAGVLAELTRRPLRKPIDLTMDDIFRERRLRVYWSVPAIIGNGSEAGRTPRGIRGGAWRRHPAIAPIRAVGRWLGL